MTNAKSVENLTKEEIVAGIQEFTLKMAVEVLASLEEYGTTLLISPEGDEVPFLEGYLEGLDTALQIFLEAYGVTYDEQEIAAQQTLENINRVLNGGYKK